VGKALRREYAPGAAVGVGSNQVDIRNVSEVEALVDRVCAEWIVLAAAYTDVDGCETNQQLAFDVNCRGAVNVAQVAKHVGCRLLFLSTDYVFDGTKTNPYEARDQRHPRSVYGKSKAEAEIQIGDLLPDAC